MHYVHFNDNKFNQGSPNKVQNSIQNISESQLGVENPKNPGSSSLWTRIFLLGLTDQ